jgi:hypothetical protein
MCALLKQHIFHVVAATLSTQGLYVLCFKPSTSNVWVPQMRPLASVHVIGMANGCCDKAACDYVCTAWRWHGTCAGLVSTFKENP